jgi:predicted XRE-type DNA-binding protein
MANRIYRHFKDTKRARLLREHAARTQSLQESVDSLPPMEQLCEGGGNVFAELGFLHPEQELLKALLTIQIRRIIKERNLNQVQTAEILGIGQQQISALKNNRLSSFSVGRLIELLVILGHDVEIAIRPTQKARGQVSLTPLPVSHDGLLPKLRSLFVWRPAKKDG